MRAFLMLALSPLLLAVAGCADLLDDEPNKPKLTPLEIQSLQQRDLETSKDIAFASVVSVLQDLGYTISSADKDTGFITGQSLAQTSEEEGLLDIVVDGLLDIDEDYGLLTVQTKATAFVEAFTEERARVRLSFVKSKFRSGSDGQNSTKDKQVLDTDVYRNAFDKIENAIFIREGAGT